MITNHYGFYVDSEVPVTGVIKSNDINWEYVDDEICIDCESSYVEIENDKSLSEEEKEHELEFIECDSSHTKLIGDWTIVTNKELKKNKDKCMFIVDKKGYYPNKEKEFSAIVRESEVQVVCSKYITTGNLCSPCYPGQVDLNTSGEYLAYTLPPELIYTESYLPFKSCDNCDEYMSENEYKLNQGLCDKCIDAIN